MTFDSKEFYRNTATFDEILSKDFFSQKATTKQISDAKLKASLWCGSSFGGDWSLFTKRLARDNLEIDFVLKRFANSELCKDAKLPTWLDDINWVYDEFINKNENSDDELVIKRHADTIPFIKIYLNLINSTYTKLFNGLTISAQEMLSINAKIDLKSNLLGILSDICDECLFHNFKENFYINDKPAPYLKSSNQIYITKYIDDLRASLLKRIIKEKPVLFRLIVVSIRNWLDANTEMLTRVFEDKEILKETYGVQTSNLLLIESIKGGISDFHNKGRSVHIIEFSNRLKVVYKPKDCSLDKAFSILIKELNSICSEILLKTANVIVKNGYGWSEFIAHSECASNYEVETFFKKSGAYLALFHILCATDMHHENIIADGSDPVPIDLEMLLQPDDSAIISSDLEKAAHEENAKITASSILNIGLIPTYVKSSEGKLISVGGLNYNNDTQDIYGWASPNHDSIRRIKITFKNSLHHNLPKLNNQTCLFENNIKVFINGFKYYSEFLINLNSSYLNKLIIDIFSNHTTRKVMRPTRFYFGMLQRLKDFRKMNDSINWSFQSDFLARFFEWDKVDDLIWPIAKHERMELAELNIPTFYSPVGKSKITNNHKLNINFNHALSGLDKSFAKLKKLSLHEIDLQISIIESILNIEVNFDKNPQLEISSIKDKKSNKISLLDEVNLIVKKIIGLAKVEDRSASWIGINWYGGGSKSHFSTLGPDLYNGNAGIAIFLAAAFKVTSSDEIRLFTYKTISSLRHDINNTNSARFARSLGIGGAVGISSIIYSLVVISDLLNDSSLIDDANKAAKLITKELVDSSKEFDIVSGCAGAILCLLKLYSKTHEKWLLEKAMMIGDSIITKNNLNLNLNFNFNDQRHGSSNNSKISLLNGMSHGAAGISYALAKLASISKDKNYLNASTQLIEFENSNFDLYSSNWPSPISNNISLYKSKKICQWCHGSIGVGLSRIAVAKLGNKEHLTLLDDVFKAIEGCRLNTNYRTLDTLCCGIMGAIEFYQEAGFFLNNHSLVDQANKYLLESISHSHNPTKDYYFGGGSSNFHLGFFKGISGIGYTILRRIDNKLPNVLIWE